MRIIKFKQAIREQSAVGVVLPFHWHYWGYLGNEFDGLTLPLGRMDGDERLSYQYTGMKDKEAKEIYEGDICRYRNSLTDKFITIAYNEQLGSFVMRGLEYWDCHIIKNETESLEVYGNIYETPELLEAK